MSSLPTCRFWLQGRCRRGASCQFRLGIASPITPGKNILADTGVLLENIGPDSLTEAVEDDQAIVLSDFKFLSSYNWVDEDTPVIYVPGRNVHSSIAKDYLLIVNRSTTGLEPQRSSFHGCQG